MFIGFQIDLDTLLDFRSFLRCRRGLCKRPGISNPVSIGAVSSQGMEDFKLETTECQRAVQS